MDSLTLIDTVKFVDTVKVIDTLSVKVLTDGMSFPQIVLEVGKIIISAIMVYIAAVIAFKYGLKKDRIINEEKENDRLKNIKHQLFYSIDLLINGTKNQAGNIEEYRKQFITEDDLIMSNKLDRDFHMDNINAIKIEDIFKIFIIKNSNNREIRSKLYNDLNLCFRIIQDVIENFDKKLFIVIDEINKYHDMFNGFKKETLKIISDLREELRKGTLSENERFFLTTAQVIINNNKIRTPGGIFTEKEKMYDELFKKAKEYEIFSFINLYYDIEREVANYKFLKQDFNNKFLNYVKNLTGVHERFIVISLEFKDTD